MTAGGSYAASSSSALATAAVVVIGLSLERIAGRVGLRIEQADFTTKPVGQGTGLGLSMSYGIIRDHGGSIDFESEPGRGTRFTLVVPFSPIPRFASPGVSRAQNTRPAPTQA